MAVLFYHVLGNCEFSGLPVVHAIVSKGHLGLDLFFFISGFIIPYSMYMNGYSTKDFPRYLLKRSCRIEIPYIASFLLIIAARMIHSSRFGEVYVPDWTQFFLHFLYLNQYFDKEAYMVVYWTLALEFQFYILIGLLFRPIMHKVRWVPLGLFVGWSLACWFIWTPYNHYIIQYGFIFMAGIIVFLFRVRYLPALSFSGLFAMTLIMMYFTNGLEVVLTTTFGACVVLALNRQWRVTDFLGTISFSLYLVHTEAAGWLNLYIRDLIQNTFLLNTLLIAFTLSFAIGFDYIIERPALRLSKRIGYGAGAARAKATPTS